MSGDLSHFDAAGNARMVDVGDKEITDRLAVAECVVRMAPATLERIEAGRIGKGDVLQVARIAGIMAAKRTADLIPLCHPVTLDKVDVDLAPDRAAALVRITATCRVRARTGVEMEALSAVTIAGLTVYDMCKAIDRGMVVDGVRLLRKEGGRSGVYAAGGIE